MQHFFSGLEIFGKNRRRKLYRQQPPSQFNFRKVSPATLDLHWGALVYWYTLFYVQQLLQRNRSVRDAVPNAAKYSFRHICVFLPFGSEGFLVKTKFMWQVRHLHGARLISTWPRCSLCPGLGGHFIPVRLTLASYQPWAVCRLVEPPGTWLFQSGLKDHPCPLGLPPASHATLKWYLVAFGNGPLPWSSGPLG